MNLKNEWKECAICRALVYSTDEVCCVCHSPLEGNTREVHPLAEWATG